MTSRNNRYNGYDYASPEKAGDFFMFDYMQHI